ncbi:MAG: hypothetical protein V7L20_29855 [Nostoc sp.]|uniref:hypothetical protein n=1 Tax=Nostoc sp. TaxID=1180 RepID=UPI002FF583AE
MREQGEQERQGDKEKDLSRIVLVLLPIAQYRILRLTSATSTSPFDYAQLLKRLRHKRSYAAGFTTTKRTSSVQVPYA